MAKSIPSPLSRHLRLITAAGSLAMFYISCTTCPLATEFFRDLGARKFHFGLLAGLPLCMLFMQFLGAFLANRLKHRKPVFMTMLIICRLLYIPMAFLPMLLPDLSIEAKLAIMIGLLAVSRALANLSVPLWFSWVGDLVPRRILNRYWGVRQSFMTLMWTLTYLAIGIYTFCQPDIPARLAYPIIATIGVAAGVVDICLFAWVKEPENAIVQGRAPLEVLLEPLRHRDYRTLVIFSCSMFAAQMIAAGFMQLYALEVLGLTVWQLTLVWCGVGLGGALVYRAWGRMADRFGHRPILILCTSLKSVVTLVFLLVTPRFAVYVLAATFFFDSLLNAGKAIAANGFMLKTAPRENRSMFIAAGTALAGLAGGLSAILGGRILDWTEGLSVEWLGREWTNYHLIFLMSLVLRLACIPLAVAIREPKSARTGTVLNYMRGRWPMRMMVFPVGLYRRYRADADESDDEPEDAQA